MTYQEMKDLINHRLFQNTATEAVTDSDIVSSMNAAQYAVAAALDHPFLLWNRSASAAVEGEATPTLSKTINFDGEIKKVITCSVTLEDWGDTFPATRVMYDPRDYETAGSFEYKCYNNTMVFGSPVRTAEYYGETFCPIITTDSDFLIQQFPLGNQLAITVCEYCMMLLVPVNIEDGYNLAQFHQKQYQNMLHLASWVLRNLTWYNNIKNELK